MLVRREVIKENTISSLRVKIANITAYFDYVMPRIKNTSQYSTFETCMFKALLIVGKL